MKASETLKGSCSCTWNHVHVPCSCPWNQNHPLSTVEKSWKVQRKLAPKRGSDVSRRNPTPNPSGSVGQGHGGFIFLSRISYSLHLWTIFKLFSVIHLGQIQMRFWVLSINCIFLFLLNHLNCLFLKPKTAALCPLKQVLQGDFWKWFLLLQGKRNF